MRLWRISDCHLLSSDYALYEARRNLATKRPDRPAALSNLSARIEIATVPGNLSLPKAIQLDAADRPILTAAIHSRATHLLTGDKRDFGHLMTSRVEGIMIMLPGEYLALRSR